MSRRNNVFVTGYEKMTVDQDYDLRKVVRGAGGRYKVVKNNIAEMASEGLRVGRRAEGPARHDLARVHHGRSGGLAKALTVYAKTNPAFTFKAGLVEGRAIDVKEIAELAACRRRKRFRQACCT